MIKSHTIAKERWQFAVAGLTASAPLMAAVIRKKNFAGQGEQAAEQYLSDIELAVCAMNYVSEFAADSVRFVSQDDASFEAALQKLRDLGGIR
ncbi:MAG: hypothetical protein FWD98_03785 [Defluviitaleaceae bacterium]|nr:hypothetical protein [Defluviitaleaceae bacterium]